MSDDYPITWSFVWQGVMTQEEMNEFAEKQGHRMGIEDGGGLWLEAEPERCETEGHVPRFHPNESFQSYCVICGEYPVEDPQWAEIAEKMKDPEYKAKIHDRMQALGFLEQSEQSGGDTSSSVP